MKIATVKTLALLLTLPLLVPARAGGLEPGEAVPAPAPNGRISLYFMGPPTEDRLRLARLSKIVEADLLSEEQRADLLARGVRLMLYDWIFAAYEWEAGEYDPDDFLVRFEGPYGLALAYDYGSEELRRKRVRALVEELEAGNYSAIFFDWFPPACSEEWASEVQGYVQEFRRRHPGQTLWDALREFLLELRRQAAESGIDLLIVSNQAYRCGPDPLRYVDWDVSESYFTDVRGGETVLFPWDRNSWDSPALYVRELVVGPYEEARQTNHRLGFFHLSYAIPGPRGREAAFYACAGARVFGHEGMAFAPSEVNGEVSPDGIPGAYWLGCWRGSTFGDRWAVGIYDSGLVAVGQGPAKVPGWLVGAAAFDLFDGAVIQIPEALDYGPGPWGRVLLILPTEAVRVECPSWTARVPLFGEALGGALESLAEVGGCSASSSRISPVEAAELWSFWREPAVDVTVVSNDVDWNLSGVALVEALRGAGIRVERANLTFEGLRRALLNSSVVVVLGGPESPVLGELLAPLMSSLGEAGEYDLGPGRVLLWLWGEDRYETQRITLEMTALVLMRARDATSPVPRCHALEGG